MAKNQHNEKKAARNPRPGKLAEDLRIGDRFPGIDGQGNAGKVKALHELCPNFDGPHVHVVASSGHRCFPFGKYV